MGRADITEKADAIVRVHAGFVWRILSHLGVPANQLELTSQRVLISVHRRLGEFRGETSITTWIYGICRTLAAELRHERPPTRETKTEQPACLPLTQRLHRALQGLSEPTRMVFVLFEIECLPMKEVAAAVGCSQARAYTWLYGAREHLRRSLLRPSNSDRVSRISPA
ncbi:MAG TPA: sigma-70 family RNA polymerase sigma factor [Polyangiales bacterium]|nr:sigma-70 family RNA polymerase sigma factor [Polyangiales bacterium]